MSAKGAVCYRFSHAYFYQLHDNFFDILSVFVYFLRHIMIPISSMFSLYVFFSGNSLYLFLASSLNTSLWFS